jgi:uncharacterized protein YijF (DUF1287 family)
MPRYLPLLVVIAGCAAPPPRSEPDKVAPVPAVAAAPEAPAITKDPDHAPESCLGVADQGIWSDLDEQVQLALPAGLDRARVEGVVSSDGDTLVVYVDGWPTKPYPLTGGALRPGDETELRGLLDDGNRRLLADGELPPPGDRDGDDLPDPLDILIGAKKTVAQASPYSGGYIELDYPMGDLPRTMGVCTDVVIRSLRNAGLDLQVAIRKDIRASKKSYPMVKGDGDTTIDHRRVRTILPRFKRHADPHTTALDDAADPLRPGDILFMDTLERAGPDHIGIVSDVLGESGLPLVINSWTDGYVTQEMDLLGWVPVTHRFRL